jgi:hypothetical protein
MKLEKHLEGEFLSTVPLFEQNDWRAWLKTHPGSESLSSV